MEVKFGVHLDIEFIRIGEDVDAFFNLAPRLSPAQNPKQFFPPRSRSVSHRELRPSIASSSLKSHISEPVKKWKFSLRKPYITGLVTTEVMAIRCKKVNMVRSGCPTLSHQTALIKL